jgi:hypothetical protein
MKEAPDNRRIFIWRDQEPVEANIDRFADVIVEKLAAELFDVNGSLFWLEAGGLANLRDLITRHFVSIRLGGTVDKPNGEIEYFSFEFPLVAKTNKEPDKKALNALGAALLERVAKGPQEPRRLSEQQQREVQYRLGIGEPKDKLAREYNVELETIRQVGR